jgi:hypothetical protein
LATRSPRRGRSPTGCFYFKEEGTLFVDANTPGYAVVIGKADFSDAHNSIKIDHLIVGNTSTASTAGALQLNYVLDADIYAVADSAGGAAGLALEQTQFSRISGAGTAAGTGGAAMLLENGFNFANTIFAFDFEESPTCLSITFSHDGQNTFVSPYFSCTTAVNATASTRNVLINPTYAGSVVNRGPQLSGIQVIGTGSWTAWQFPAAATYTASGVDDRTAISAFNAPGASMAVTLPDPAAVGAGWRMGFATDNGKGMSVTAPTGSILSGGKALSAVTLGPGNYEFLELQSDGNNFRVVAGTRNTLATNGLQSRDWPGNWLYPSTSGYAAQLGDNGNVLSSLNTTAGLTVTLPPTTTLPSGWSMGFATDQGKSLKVQVNGTSGGHILYPLAAASGKTSLTLAGDQYEYVTLQYDGSGNFRVEQVTPATAQQLGLAGTGGLNRWSFPAASTYAAGVVENGAVISAFNSPLGFLTVTLPPASTHQHRRAGRSRLDRGGDRIRHQSRHAALGEAAFRQCRSRQREIMLVSYTGPMGARHHPPGRLLYRAVRRTGAQHRRLEPPGAGRRHRRRLGDPAAAYGEIGHRHRRADRQCHRRHRRLGADDPGGSDIYAAIVAAHRGSAWLQVSAGQWNELRADRCRCCRPDDRRRRLGRAAAAVCLSRSRLYRQQPMDRSMTPAFIPPRPLGILGLAAGLGLLIGLTGAYVPGEP